MCPRTYFSGVFFTLLLCCVVLAPVWSQNTEDEEDPCRITEDGRLLCDAPERPKLGADQENREFFGAKSDVLQSARHFGGPGSYPPEAYRGYGIVVFPATASDFDIERHQMICSAFWASLPPTEDLVAAPEDQFVTLWPLIEDDIGDEIRKLPVDEACALAVEHYNQAAALRAIAAAKPAGFQAERRGPYLIAWSPPSEINEPDAFVLALDFSGADSYDEVLVLMRDWTRDIETDFELLADGFSMSRLRVKIRRWADRHGDGFLRALDG